ncbi:hypothetical protein ACFRAE_07215 [Sphingobacterium sp. HJSM2_6]|uniref:hypothetical protein n=1 Tax=Sphingobacterium sp. HJSM2_6 TaxID=3366264 RepID=UPI003BCA25EE
MKAILISLLLIITFSTIHGQQPKLVKIPISGMVMDANYHKPIIGVSVQFMNKEITQTDKDGYFKSEVEVDTSKIRSLSITFNKYPYGVVVDYGIKLKENQLKGQNFIIGLVDLKNKDKPYFSDRIDGTLTLTAIKKRFEQIKSKLTNKNEKKGN